MVKPRRRHPAWNAVDISPQGAHFLALVGALVGRGFSSRALARTTEDDAHVYVVEGPTGSCLLIERVAEVLEDVVVVEWVAAFLGDGGPFHVTATLRAQRWDAKRYAERTGDRSILRAREEIASRRARVATEHDRVSIEIYPLGELPDRIAGIEREDLEQVASGTVPLERLAEVIPLRPIVERAPR